MLIADVFDVILIDAQDNSVIGTTTLQQANIQVAVQETEVRGGKGNQLLGVLHANRDITLNLTDAEFRYDWLAKQLGTSIVTGAGVAYAMPTFLTVAATKEVDTLTITAPSTTSGNVTVTLDGIAVVVAVANADTAVQVADKIRLTAFAGWTVGGTVGTAIVTFTANATGVKTTPIFAGAATGVTGNIVVTNKGAAMAINLENVPNDNTSLKIYDDLEVIIPSSSYTVTGKTVAFTSGVILNDKVEVRTYTYATNARSEIISIDNAIFAKGVKAILETIEIDGSEIPLYKVQYQFDNTVPTGNFTINTQSQKTAATQQFNLKVVKPANSQVVGRVIREPLS